jgi:gamma-glutamylputrescine oxidase
MDSTIAPRASPSDGAPYDPHFDPLVSDCGQGQRYAPTYWIDTAGEPPPDDGPVVADMDTDVVVIGAGFTGLATALFLAREHGIKATVLEANRVAWGCTSRNGGQGQNASGRLYRSQWINKWGVDTARRLDREIREGFETWKGMVSQVDCDAQEGGHLYVAHRERKLEFLKRECEVMREVFGYDTRMLSREELREQHVNDQESTGALHEKEGIGIHPLKLAYGYLRMARAAGVKVHGASPVTGWDSRNGSHFLRTPGGTVRARAVGVATGGYTSQGLHPTVRNRVMPILSNSLVTRPLTEDERQAAGFKSTTFITDTRVLRFYYRLLPDNRVQIGSRSAIHGADATEPRHLELLKNGLIRKFPSLKNVQVDYSWWGWVDVSHDMMPRIVQPDPAQSIYYALGYGGNGVSFSTHAGRRLAERVAGKAGPQWNLPIYQSPLPGHPFAPFRRLGQKMLYRWYQLNDEKMG